MEILLAILLGGFFGFALYYVGSTSSFNLRSMLSLRYLSLMKIILFAIGFSSALVSIFALIGIFDISHLSVKSTNLGVIVGGLIFGLGFGFAGKCPGTCVADSSSGGLKKAISVILGGLVGAFIFTLLYGSFKELGLFDIMDIGKMTLFNISEEFPSVFNIGFGGLLSMGIVIMIIAYILPMNIKQRG